MIDNTLFGDLRVVTHIGTTTELDGTVFYNGGFDQDRAQPPNEFEPQICDVVDER